MLNGGSSTWISGVRGDFVHISYSTSHNYKQFRSLACWTTSIGSTSLSILDTEFALTALESCQRYWPLVTISACSVRGRRPSQIEILDSEYY